MSVLILGPVQFLVSAELGAAAGWFTSTTSALAAQVRSGSVPLPLPTTVDLSGFAEIATFLSAVELGCRKCTWIKS